jgi:hypothetical protein
MGKNYLVVEYQGILDVYPPGELADYEYGQYRVRGGNILYYGPDEDKAKNIGNEAIKDGVTYDGDIYLAFV